MRLPGWLDIALEGGVLELERALAEYAALNRALQGRWGARALSVAEACRRIEHREDNVQRALDRARSRARLDRAARAVLPLVERVLAERGRLEVRLGAVAPAMRHRALGPLLREVAETAEETGWLQAAFARFDRERLVFVLASSACAVLVPLVCWYHASCGGVVPTLVDFRGLVDPPSLWMIVAALWVAAAFGWGRLWSWKWLGPTAPSLALPGLLTLACGGLGASQHWGGATTLAASLIAGAVGLNLASVWVAYRYRFEPVSAVQPAPLDGQRVGANGLD